MLQETPVDLRTLIGTIGPEMSLHEIAEIAFLVFTAHFGVTTDHERLIDVRREAQEFDRALTRKDRVAELGDLVSSLMVFGQEQEVDIAAAIRNTLLKITGRAEIYALRGDKRNVAIYGGAFDMPHNGHIAVGKAILDSGGIDEVWFMPAYEYVGGKQLTDAVHRAAMCRLLETIDPRFKFFGYEMDHRLWSETLQTLLKLSAEPFADTHRLHFAVSTETAIVIEKWDRAQELIRATAFITTPRPGFVPKLRDYWFLQPPHRYLADAKGLIDLSSTTVRALYRDRKSDEARQFVPQPIHDYIVEHELYRS